jgi:hypothetical protein
MPRLLSVSATGNKIRKFKQVIRLGFSDPIGVFMAMMFMFYALFVFLGLPPLLSVFLAIGASLSADNLILWEVGHQGKVNSLAYTPLMVIGVLYLFEKQKYLLGSSLLALALASNIHARHPQMTYYVMLIFVVYGIVKIIGVVSNKRWKQFAIALGFGVLAAFLALGASASRMWSIYDYNQSSMRGKPILNTENVKNSESSNSSEVKGLDWQYAMAWSNGAGDLIATYIPGFMGGGSGQKVSKDSESYKKYRIERAPLYWGQMPFTEGPIYIGAIFIFLFVFGLFFVQGDLKKWLGFAILFMVLLSMGKHFPILNKPVFDYFPLYNNFRVPQSILTVCKFFIPILGALALRDMFRMEHFSKVGKKSSKLVMPSRFKTSLLWSAGICGGFALIMAVIGPGMFSFEGGSDAQYIQNGTDIGPFISDRKALLRSDSFRTFLLVGLTAGAMWMFAMNKLKKVHTILIIGALILFDVLTVGSRYFSQDDFVNPTRLEQNFNKRAVDEQILAQEPKREGYRVLDLTINTFNSAMTSNWHNTIGGYHPAKLQRYQDVIEQHISRNNMSVMHMLNCKYFIVNGQNGKPAVQGNPEALGNAWFVDDVVKVNTPTEEISALSNFDPARQSIILDSEFDNYIGVFDPQKDVNGSIVLSDYEPDHLTYQTSATSEQLAVFSEVWYGPNRGWTMTIDGDEVPFIRANYILRAARIPAGQHTVEFVFRPNSYYAGHKISLISSVLLILVFLGLIGSYVYKIQSKGLNIVDVSSESVNKTEGKKTKRTTSPKRKSK